MKAVLLGGVAVVALSAMSVSPVKAADAKACDPYKNYSCLDAYLGQDIWSRLVNYYKLEWGQAGPPADPKAPPGRRSYWPGTPQTTPPMPFTEWPHGATNPIGVVRTGSVDSPLMVALAKTDVGEFLNDHGLQIYGWVNGGFNVSTNQSSNFGGNNPAAYMFTPNTMQLDQAVLYVERLPDTVQKDHIDWGFRISGIYGENYRYTEAYGLWSYQFEGHGLVNGFDAPMMYGELFFPQFAEGVLVRIGRFISIPDIEAQLAPNNYMYSHSLTYDWDNYTNTGIQVSTAVTKNWLVQLGVNVGTEAMPWHWGQTTPNLGLLFPGGNPLYTGASYPVDPGSMPSFTGCLRYTTDKGWDTVYLCVDALNTGIQGFNNLQWLGGTYYHKFNEQWHISTEAYTLSQNDVLNINNPLVWTTAGTPGEAFTGALKNPGITPLGGLNIANNGPFFAQCSNPTQLTCTARVYTAVSYLNYSPNPLDNWSLRNTFYYDAQGQRTGTATRYVEIGLGLQHWLSPQIELRPEISYMRSLNAPAFDANLNPFGAAAPTKSYQVIGASDIIWHF
ncbi:MAG: outer membrane beta-barrel protein [Xanthobacteraceae bacterium]